MPTYDPEDVVIELRKRAAALGSRTITLAIAGLVLLYFVATSWFTVQPAETGIIQRFGAVHRTVGPGLHFKFPKGIEEVRMLPTARVLKEEFGFATTSTENSRTEYAGDKIPFKEVSLMLSGDLNVIDLQWIVQYRIEDPTSYLFQVRESRKAIRDTAEAVMRRVVGNRLGSEVLTVGRVGIATEVKTEMQKILSDYGTGVRLVTVELQDVTPPDPVKAQEQANREIPKARGEAVQTVTQAEGYAVERVNRAEGEATRFKAILADYKKSPEVTRSRLYLEAMSSILPQAKALYIVDSDQQAMLPMLSMDGAQQPISASQASQPPAGVNGGIQK
jgi:membrane protease subunit HflK